MLPLMKPNHLKILLLTRYGRSGASSRLRFLDYIPTLAEAGIEVTAAPFFDDAYLETLYAGRKTAPLRLLSYYIRRLRRLRRRADYDLVWLEKESLPWLPGFIERFCLRGARIVIDFDDAWFHRYDRHRNPLVRLLLGKKFKPLVSDARAVIVTNDYLADWANLQGAKSIARVPTTVDLGRYSVSESQINRFTVGWIGSPSTSFYLKSIVPALQQVGARVVLVGAGELDLPGLDVTIHPWREDEETMRLREFDVGIMPLEDDPWSRGKSAYKLLQYMAAGLPVVASPVGMNCAVVQDGINGYLAKTAEDWAFALKKLKDDPALRQRMGAAGRAIVEARYTLAGNAERIIDTLKRAATS